MYTVFLYILQMFMIQSYTKKLFEKVSQTKEVLYLQPIYSRTSTHSGKYSGVSPWLHTFTTLIDISLEPLFKELTQGLQIPINETLVYIDDLLY